MAMSDADAAKLGIQAVGTGVKLASDASANADIAAAGDRKTAEMRRNAAALNAYRPQIANARMNALRQSMTAYEGPNKILAAMEGKRGTGVNLSAFGENPLGNMSPAALAPVVQDTSAPKPGVGAPPGGLAEVPGENWHWNEGNGGYFYYGAPPGSSGNYDPYWADYKRGHQEYYKHYDKNWKELPG